MTTQQTQFAIHEMLHMTAEGEESVHATPLTTLTITQLPSTSTTMAEKTNANMLFANFNQDFS